MSIPLGYDIVLFILRGIRSAFRAVARPLRNTKSEEAKQQQA